MVLKLKLLTPEERIDRCPVSEPGSAAFHASGHLHLDTDRDVRNRLERADPLDQGHSSSQLIDSRNWYLPWNLCS